MLRPHMRLSPCLAKLLTAFISICLLPGSAAMAELLRDVSSSTTADYPVQPVPFTAVHLGDRFWSPRIETNRTITIPFAFQQCQDNKRMYNFERAAAVLRGETITDTTPPGFPFDDTDPYKVIEGAAYSLAVQPDPKLDAYLDELIAKIAAAQEPDGYLYTTRTFSPEKSHGWAGKNRWELERELSHELYNLGHLYEAAAAHYQATGKRNLLDIALKTADLLDRTFGPGKQAIWPGHQITEMGLVKLYRITGEKKYLDLAKFLLDVRGPDGHKGAGSPYNQSHLPVTQQTEAVGHAVRATYMYSGMADVAAMTGDSSYLHAMDAIWSNVASTKLYITGGIGATRHGEAFGKNYELPNLTAYNETCAAIGNVYWNHRLFLLHADAKYIDVLERSLYNGLISGVSLDGKAFFYPNPLESNGRHERSPWFGCACCPSNICRFIASVPGYVYAVKPAQDNNPAQVFVNLYAAGTADVPLAQGATISFTQQTTYPWDGNIKLTVNAAPAQDIALKLRIPGWSRNQPVPSDLYHYTDSPAPAPTLKLNGQLLAIDQISGYATLARKWQQGDVVELDLPMPVRRVASHPSVAANVGRVALERGPIVYCFEWPDQPLAAAQPTSSDHPASSDSPSGKVRNLLLPDNSAISVVPRPDLLNGVVTLTTTAIAYSQDAAGNLTKVQTPATAIPYYAWAHRGSGEMSVWLANVESAVRPARPPTNLARAKITASGGTNPAAVADGAISQGDEDLELFHFWPRKGTSEWVQYTFPEPRSVNQSRVYWFDDTGRGECRIPASWKLLYLDAAGNWQPVAPVFPHLTYTTTKDAWNPITFEPITTTAVRIEIQLPDKFSTGVTEWQVE